MNCLLQTTHILLRTLSDENYYYIGIYKLHIFNIQLRQIPESRINIKLPAQCPILLLLFEKPMYQLPYQNSRAVWVIHG